MHACLCTYEEGLTVCFAMCGQSQWQALRGGEELQTLARAQLVKQLCSTELAYHKRALQRHAQHACSHAAIPESDALPYALESPKLPWRRFASFQLTCKRCCRGAWLQCSSRPAAYRCCCFFGKCLHVRLTVPGFHTVAPTGDNLIIYGIVDHAPHDTSVPAKGCLQAKVLIIQFDCIIQASSKEVITLADIQQACDKPPLG